MSSHTAVSIPLLKDDEPKRSDAYLPRVSAAVSSSNSSWRSPRRGVVLPLALLGFCFLCYTAITRSDSPTSTGVKDVLRYDYWRAQSSAEASSSASAPIPPVEDVEDRWVTASKPLPLDATLDERLEAWDSAPQDEPANWVAKNLETCDIHRVRPNQNMQMHDKADMLWHSMNSTAIYSLRKQMIDHLKWCAQVGKLRENRWGVGRGLVFTAGNVDTFHRVLVTLRLLHHQYKSPLPSEIFSFPGEIPDDETRRELESLGARLFTVGDAVRDKGRTKNYHIKATAIIRSSFREVLYLDSDNMPAASIATYNETVPLHSAASNATSIENDERTALTGLWESKAYKKLGVMFWPDYWRTSADNPIWAIMGVPCRDEWEQEAGQILIDKKRHLDALLLSEWLMDSDRFTFFFNFSDGDKDMFRFAFLALRKRWGLPGRYVGVAALPRDSMTGFCGHTMLQHDHLGRPLFVHANLLKQIPSGIGRGFAWGRTRQVHIDTNELQLPPGNPIAIPEAQPLVDHGVEADMLANAQNDGRAMQDAPAAVRRRATLERGLRPFFHGGWQSALCIDMRWEDPRTGDELQSARIAAAGYDYQGNMNDVDVSYTVSGDGVEIKFENPLEVVQWRGDGRLRDFEQSFFAEGGKLNAVGF